MILTGRTQWGETTATQVITALLKSDPDLRFPKVLVIPEMLTLIMGMEVNGRTVNKQ